jgi:heme/copper-type cytochrome/quinol oxidase subunit 2
MIDWIPIVLVTFKVLVLAIGMFFAIKWHYDQGNKKMDTRALLRISVKVTAVFVLLVLALLLVTFVFARMLGLDLSL